MRSFLQLLLTHAPRLSLALFGERHSAPLILLAFIRRTENSRRTTISIIWYPALSPKNPATNECFSTKCRDVGDCKFARTWISRSSAANMPSKAPPCCWCLHGTSISIAGCTRGWPCYARLRTVLRLLVPGATDSYPLAIIVVGSSLRPQPFPAVSCRLQEK